MNLKLKNPIIFFDLETTGVDISNDRVVEISMLKVNPDGSKEKMTERLNPTIPIPLEVSEIHGIFDIDVEHSPTFLERAKAYEAFIGGADLAGFNSNRFDIPILAEEFLRADIEFSMKNRKAIDVQTIYHKLEPRTLTAAYQYYCNKNLENAHSAEADAIATYEVLESQIEKYEELQGDADFLADFSEHTKVKKLDLMGRIGVDENNNAIFNFGKYKGQRVIHVFDKDPAYYGWMMNGNFPLYTKQVLKELREEWSSKSSK